MVREDGYVSPLELAEPSWTEDTVRMCICWCNDMCVGFGHVRGFDVCACPFYPACTRIVWCYRAARYDCFADFISLFTHRAFYFVLPLAVFTTRLNPMLF